MILKITIKVSIRYAVSFSENLIVNICILIIWHSCEKYFMSCQV